MAEVHRVTIGNVPFGLSINDRKRSSSTVLPVTCTASLRIASESPTLPAIMRTKKSLGDVPHSMTPGDITLCLVDRSTQYCSACTTLGNANRHSTFRLARS